MRLLESNTTIPGSTRSFRTCVDIREFSFEGGAIEGGAFEGGAFEGGAFEGDAFEGGAFEGDAFEGDAFEGEDSVILSWCE